MEGIDRLITVNDLKLHYVEHGAPGNPAFVCLHGMAMQAHMWDTLASQISDRYHVLALTARGHSDSDRAENYDGLRFVDDAAAFIDMTSSAPAIVCGLSMGSGVGLGLAALHPDKVAKLIAVEGGPQTNPEGRKRIADAIRTSPTEFDTIEEVMEASRVTLRGVPDDELRRYLEHTTVRGDDGKLRRKGDPKFVQGWAESGNAAGSTDDTEKLLWTGCSMIKCPTLIVRGSRSDMLTRDCAERMVATITNAQLVEVDAEHVVPLENPAGFYEAVRQFI